MTEQTLEASIRRIKNLESAQQEMLQMMYLSKQIIESLGRK